MYSVHYTLYSVWCTVYGVQCIVKRGMVELPNTVHTNSP